LQAARAERIAVVALEASAHWHVVLDIADGVLAAGSGTRILALALDAGAIGGTVRAQNTLRATAFVRVAKVVRNAHASSSTITLLALGVGSTWRRFAWVDNFS